MIVSRPRAGPGAYAFRVTARRRFLVLCGAAGTGIFLANTGFIELPKRMVLQLAGNCSFCGKARGEVFGMAGLVGMPTRICDECIGLCFDIIREEIETYRSPASPSMTSSSSSTTGNDDGELERLLREAGTKAGVDPRELIARIHERLSPPSGQRPVMDDFHCSFCGRSRREVRKLISGPRVFICDDCTADAGGLLAASGWMLPTGA